MRDSLLVVLAALPALFPDSSAQSDAQNKRLAIVISVKGDATYSVGTVDRAKLRAGLSLPEGTRIQTSSRGTVDLYFRQIESVFRLMPGTDLAIERLERQIKEGAVVRHTVVRLDRGRILTRARVRAEDATFEIRMPKLTYTVPDAGVARFDLRADGRVIVGKKSELPLRAVDPEAGRTNLINPSQAFAPKEKQPENANPAVLDELVEVLTELDDLARALTTPSPPPR